MTFIKFVILDLSYKSHIKVVQRRNRLSKGFPQIKTQMLGKVYNGSYMNSTAEVIDLSIKH